MTLLLTFKYLSYNCDFLKLLLTNIMTANTFVIIFFRVTESYGDCNKVVFSNSVEVLLVFMIRNKFQQLFHHFKNAFSS